MSTWMILCIGIPGLYQPRNTKSTPVSGCRAAEPCRPVLGGGKLMTGIKGEDQTCLRRNLICSTDRVLRAWSWLGPSSQRERNGR